MRLRDLGTVTWTLTAVVGIGALYRVLVLAWVERLLW